MRSSLPAAPNLEQFRKLARELHRGYRAGAPDATARAREHHTHPGDDFRLADAQLVVAREHSFASWPRLRAYVDRSPGAGPTCGTRSRPTSATTRSGRPVSSAPTKAASRRRLQ